MALVVRDALCMERVDRRGAVAGHAAKENAILDVDARFSAGLQDAQQLGGEEIHLREEVFIVIRVPEIVV